MSTEIGVNQRRKACVLYVYNLTGAWAPWAHYMSGVYILPFAFIFFLVFFVIFSFYFGMHVMKEGFARLNP